MLFRSEIRVTVSIGAIIPSALETPLQVLDRADKMMYLSKANGRNRVTMDA